MNDNPWHRLPDRAPFVLPEDRVPVEEFNRSALDKYKLRVEELLPEPFVGDPNATVVLLANNPGFGSAASFKQEPGFVARMRENLLHRASDCPFIFFARDINPELRLWWERKLKALLRLFKQDDLSKAILSVEYFPYPSRKYRKSVDPLPSGAQAYNVRLVEKAMERKAVIVLMRGYKRWTQAVPALDGYDRFYRLKNPQAGTVSSRNCEDFGEIVQAIGTHVRNRPSAGVGAR